MATLFDNETYRPLQRPPATQGPRWCYRCADCLAVVFAGADLPGNGYERIGDRYIIRVADCGQCGGPVERMGKVEAARLTVTETVCACDARCTGATGPNCECACKGANHGTGRTVDVVRDHGPVPRLVGFPDYEARQRAQEFRDTMSRAQAALDAIKARGEGARGWLSDADYQRACLLRRLISEAGKNRTHKSRMDKLRRAVAS